MMYSIGKLRPTAAIIVKQHIYFAFVFVKAYIMYNCILLDFS